MKKIIFMGAICTMFFMFACQKEEANLKSNENDIKVVSPELSVKNDILYFSDINAVKDYIVVLNKMSNEEFKTWENQYGFSSIYTRFDEFSEKEARLVEQYDAGVEKDYEAEFAKIEEEYKNVIFLETDNDGLKTNKIDIEESIFARLLDESGMIAVNDKVYNLSKEYEGDNDFDEFKKLFGKGTYWRTTATHKSGRYKAEMEYYLDYNGWYNYVGIVRNYKRSWRGWKSNYTNYDKTKIFSKQNNPTYAKDVIHVDSFSYYRSPDDFYSEFYWGSNWQGKYCGAP